MQLQALFLRVIHSLLHLSQWLLHKTHFSRRPLPPILLPVRPQGKDLVISFPPLTVLLIPLVVNLLL
jgi:hypothetical protein